MTVAAQNKRYPEGYAEVGVEMLTSGCNLRFQARSEIILRGVERDLRRSLCRIEADLRGGLSGVLQAQCATGDVGQICRGVHHLR
jgi:hypothetical protein